MRERKRRAAQANRLSKGATGDGRVVSNIVCRTKFFDDLIVRLTGSSGDGLGLPEPVAERLQVTADRAAADRSRTPQPDASEDEAAASTSHDIRQVCGHAVGTHHSAERLAAIEAACSHLSPAQPCSRPCDPAARQYAPHRTTSRSRALKLTHEKRG